MVPLAMAVFELDAVSFLYGGRPALQDVSLQVEAGERIALLGANGSGKSTLLRLLDGLHLPSNGSIRFHGEALTEERLQHADFALGFRRRVGLLFQDPDVQLFNSTVFDEVAFGPLQLGWTRDEVLARVEDALAFLDIVDLRDRAPFHLSGGEKKRVALASILVIEPEVLLLDEPTAALDPRSETQLLDFLKTLPEKVTLIVATHDLHMAQEVAQSCCVLDRGRLIRYASTADVLSDTLALDRANLIYKR